MYDSLLMRYKKGYVTHSQLDRYVTLGKLTKEEAATIKQVEKEV